MNDYKDSDGNKIDLYRLINKEPEWAVTKINEAEKHRKLLKDHIEINELLMVENKALKASRNSILKSLRTILNLPAAKIHWEAIEENVKKAEALKEKEA